MVGVKNIGFICFSWSMGINLLEVLMRNVYLSIFVFVVVLLFFINKLVFVFFVFMLYVLI